MSEVIKCPVCDKAGIPDYHKEEVVCPCCGTDLSIYKLLSDSKETPQATNNKRWKIATAASAAIAIIALIFVWLPNQQKTVEYEELDKKVKVLTDSIIFLTNQLNLANQKYINLRNTNVTDGSLSDNIYIVKRNDSPCKISWKLYGTEKRYKEIEAIMPRPILHPGDTLKLK